jgi:hypothetical protein
MNNEDRHNLRQERSAREFVRNGCRDIPKVSVAETCLRVLPKVEPVEIEIKPKPKQ